MRAGPMQGTTAMIRTFIVAAGFLSIALVLYLQQPGAEDAAPAVTRSGAGLDRTVLPDATEPAADTSVDLAGLDAAVSSATEALSSAPRPAAAEDPLRDMTASVLADLGITNTPGSGGSDPDQMADLTQGILAGINAARAPSASQAPQPGLADLVSQALRQGQSDAYIDALLNGAARSGRIAVPGALVTAEGRVDTRILLQQLVSQAASATEAPTVLTAAAVAPSPVTRPASRTDSPEFYTVAAGDSLGSIAIRFYGNFDLYQTIFEANRGVLSSPDQIRAGQRLVIPAI